MRIGYLRDTLRLVYGPVLISLETFLYTILVLNLYIILNCLYLFNLTKLCVNKEINIL